MSVLEDLFEGSGLDRKNHIELRKKLYAKDKSLMVHTDVIISPEDIDTACSGRLVIRYKGVDYETVFNRKDTSDRLYIILNGARNTGDSLPIHKRWSYYNYIDGTMLNIADPMLRDYDNKLRLGWYYGNSDVCYVNRIVDIARIAAVKLVKKEIIFIGSSGGGYAALLAACNCMGSTAIAINPQIQLSLWNYRETFEEVTGMSLTERDKFCRNHLPELIKESVNSKFMIINNMYSKEDIEQINTVSERFGKEIAYGVNKLSNNVLVWMYDADNKPFHNAQDYPTMFLAIDYLYRHFAEAERLKELYLIFGEFWAEHWNTASQLNELKQLKANKSKSNGVSLITIYDETNHSVEYKVVKKEHCTIEATDNIWNNKCVYDGISKNKLYKIEINNPELSAQQNEFTLLIRENVTNELLLNVTLPAEKNRSLVISTDRLSHKAKLKLYSGVVGKANGISLEADIAVYEIITV